MKKKVFCMCVFAVYFLALLFPGGVRAQKAYDELTFPPLKDIVIPEPQVVKLENGLELFLLEDHEFPFITISAMTRTGNVYEPADKLGLAGICGTVMRTGGSTNMQGDEMDEMLEAIAASVETYIDLTYGGARLFTLKDHIDPVLEAFAGILMDPALPEDKIDLARIEMKSMISRRNDDPGAIAAREFTALIYGEGSVYSRYPEYDHIDAISRDDLLAFHRRFYHPDNTIMAVSGDFNTSGMVKKIEEAFKGWEKSSKPVPDIPEFQYDFKPSVNLVVKEDINQSNIYMGHIGDLKSNPDYFTLIVLNNAFGQGFSSRLFRNVRSEKGLAYHVRGIYNCNYDYPGVFSMVMQTKAESTVEAIKVLQEELQKIITEEITAKELETARNTFLNSFVFNFDSTAEIIERMLEYTYYGYPLDFLAKTKSGIEGVTAADVLRVAKKYFNPAAQQILVVGNPEGFGEPLSLLGDVKEIDITIPPPSKEAMPEATPESLARGMELLEKMTASLGGKEKFAAVKSLLIDSRTTLTTPMGAMALDIQSIMLLPDRAATTIRSPMGEMKQIVTPEGAWMEFNGVRALPPSQWEEAKATLFRNIVNLCTFADRLTAQYLGEEEIDGALTDVILVSDAEGHRVKIFIARDSGYPVRQVYDATIQTGPASLTLTSSDFREVGGGIIMPFHELVLADGKEYAENARTEIQVNVEVDTGFFEKPNLDEKK